ncbi:hypothetical protein QJS10_CPB14g00106 [Acorus calamus]|uniref:Uncharacterized protein n=1 Tax=Acorus calamus TaxID=4465 RepID=A0AAV9DCE2_ACOCL|nr:hypothetical protein QJS10_CPB14g00106 [Acorus calamus]
METPLVRKICENLIACAIQRCRLSDNLCRLSIALKCLYESDPPSVFISISDTGAGSSLAEFRELDCWSDHDCAEKWDGMLSITTTCIDDNHIYRYILSLKEAAGAVKRLTKLPPTSKKGKFSGTEVRLSPPMECCSDFVAWMTCFCRKILVLKAPKIATEFTVEHVNNIGSKCEHILQPNHGSFLPHSMPNIECLISGLEDYVLKHEHVLDKECQSCFSCSRENLKVGSGAASSTDVLKDTGQMVEAVIVVAEAQTSVDMLCSRSFSPATEVLYFQDFSPCQIPWSTFEALTSIDWQSYGLTLKSNAVNGDGHATLEWDNLPPSTHIAIVLHSYNKKYPPYVTVVI